MTEEIEDIALSLEILGEGNAQLRQVLLGISDYPTLLVEVQPNGDEGIEIVVTTGSPFGQTTGDIEGIAQLLSVIVDTIQSEAFLASWTARVGEQYAD